MNESYGSDNFNQRTENSVEVSLDALDILYGYALQECDKSMSISSIQKNESLSSLSEDDPIYVLSNQLFELFESWNLKSSLWNLVDTEKLERLISFCLKCLQKVRKSRPELKDVSQEELISIMLWTSNLLYQKLNAVLKESGDISKWKVYLNTFLNGLKSMSYYRGQVYQGWNYKDLKTYQKGETVSYKAISSFSKNRDVAEKFSNGNGTIFQVEVLSSRDISSLSIYLGEEEVVMPPYSYFEVTNVIEAPGKPVIVEMKEIPTPRTPKVVLWIDDNPERNYGLVQKIEKNQISCLFCLSTKDAVRVIERHQWLLYLESPDFKIITNMARIEDGVLESQAGVDLIHKLVMEYRYFFEILIFCHDPEGAQKDCDSRKLKGRFSITDNSRDVLEFLNLEKRKRNI